MFVDITFHAASKNGIQRNTESSQKSDSIKEYDGFETPKRTSLHLPALLQSHSHSASWVPLSPDSKEHEYFSFESINHSEIESTSQLDSTFENAPKFKMERPSSEYRLLHCAWRPFTLGTILVSLSLFLVHDFPLFMFISLFLGLLMLQLLLQAPVFSHLSWTQLQELSTSEETTEYVKTRIDHDCIVLLQLLLGKRNYDRRREVV